MRVLLVEDDPVLGSQVKELLAKSGHNAVWVRSGHSMPPIATVFDVIVMDITLPGKNGVEIVASLRAAGTETPVMFLSALAQVSDRVRGLRGGGDDYLTKPFESEELIARIEALGRRSHRTTKYEIKGWTLDPVKRRIHTPKATLELQPREWALLDALMHAPGCVLTKAYLLENVWDIRFDPGTNVVDAMICKLRAKLETLGGGAHIETIRGKGYVFSTTP